MRRIFKIFAGFIVFFIVAAVSVPFLVPVDVFKAKALAVIEEATGRKVTMGAIKLSVFPNIALSANDVSIGNPAWVKGGGAMAEIKNLRIGVELLPLLHSDVHVTDVTLESPVVRLVRNATQANWQFAPASTPVKPATEEAKSAKAKATTSFRLDSVSIKNGLFSLEDSASGTKQLVSDVNLKVTGKNLQESVSVTADAVYNGTKASISTLTLNKPFDVTAGIPADINLKAGFGALEVAWQGTIAMKGKVPSLTGTIDVAELDTTAAPAGKEVSGKAAPAASSKERWSSAPISMEPLSAVNADVVVTIDKLVLTKMTIAGVRAHVMLQNGNLQTDVDELKLFGGSVKLDVSAQHSGAAGVKAAIKGMQMEEMLMTLADSKVFSGTLNATVAMNTHGKSQRDMVSALAGNGSFQLTDGVYRGGNLLNMTKNIATSFQGGQSKGETTDFSKLAGTFTAQNGVITNNDLKMDGPLLSLTGAGQIDLPQWLVHYLLTPVLMTNRGSETQAASGISVPVQVEGSLDAPTYHPDLRGAVQDALKDPEKLKENIKNVKENFKDLKKGLNKDTLKNLLGR